MALDHYVSQVHLRQFCFPDAEGKLFVVRKSDLKQFWAVPKNVCAVQDGNQIKFLPDPDLLEKLFAIFEPGYPQAISDLRAKKKSYVAREIVSSFMAAVNVSAPAFKRMLFAPTHKTLMSFANKVAAFDDLPTFPITGNRNYDGKTLAELLEENQFKFEINMQIPQALAVSKLPNVIDALSTSHWDVLHLTQGDFFLTSDFPLALLETKINGYIARFMPLARDIGVVVYTIKKGVNTSPGTQAHINVTAKSQVATLNRCIVKSAEEFVISHGQPIWLSKVVKKSRNTHLEIDPNSRDLIYATK